MQLNMETIRKRPGMFVGSTGQTGVYNLIFELVEEFIYISKEINIFIIITLNDDNSLLFICNRPIDVEDNTTLTIVKALSDIFELNFANEQQDSVKILFRPDKDIFTYDRIDYYKLYNRLKELAQLNENVKFLLSDSINKNLIQYHNGLNTILYENMYDFNLEHCQPINIYFVEDDVEVSLSMLLGHPADVAISYVNNSKTHGGGTHVQGLYDGTYCVFKKYIKRFDDEQIKLSKKDLINDLNFVISVKISNPSYGGNSKRTLSDNRVQIAIRNGIVQSLDRILESDKSFFNASSVIRRAAFMHVFKSALKKNNPDINWSE